MNCQECLARYSEIVDDGVDMEGAARLRAHLLRCPSCARYHRVMQTGLQMVRGLPPVLPSMDFEARLQHRVFHVQDEMWRHDRFATTGVTMSLVLAAMIALVAWGPVMMRELESRPASAVTADGVAETSPVAADVVPSAEAAEAGQLAESWYAHPAALVGGHDGATSLSAAFPGPYSPLIVEPPVVGLSGRGVRAVFTSFHGID